MSACMKDQLILAHEVNLAQDLCFDAVEVGLHEKKREDVIVCVSVSSVASCVNRCFQASIRGNECECHGNATNNSPRLPPRCQHVRHSARARAAQRCTRFEFTTS
jgi:hypothetical protein